MVPNFKKQKCDRKIDNFDIETGNELSGGKYGSGC